jgi:cytochrome c556
MKPNPYDFRQFQQELAALDRKAATAEPAKPAKPASKKEAAQARLLQARTEFLALRERYGLTVADVVTFFPEEEGITYLQGLIAEQDAKPRRRAKSTK